MVDAAGQVADIVLPSTTTLERNDIGAAELSRFWIAMHQVVDPFAQARNDFDIFGELADRVGFGAEYHCGREEMQWLRHMVENLLVAHRLSVRGADARSRPG